MNKRIVAFSCLFLSLAIALGAFGAHGLRQFTKDEDILRAYQTGVDYHLFHGVAFLILGLLGTSLISRSLGKAAYRMLQAGIFLFSGSLYLLTVFKLLSLPYRWIGPITPIGGALLIMGWAWLGYSVVKSERTN
jgi:uncharacterized membrane protein YgdD (TMEM256/DUF423 family)